MRFEIFFCIPFLYLQCCEGFIWLVFRFLVATMNLLRFLFREYRWELWTEEISKPMIWAGLVWAGLGLCGLGWVPHITNNFHEIWNILLHFSFSVPSVLWRLYFVGGDGIYRSLDITKGKKTNDLFPPPLLFSVRYRSNSFIFIFIMFLISYLVCTAWTIKIWWKQKLRCWNKSFCQLWMTVFQLFYEMKLKTSKFKVLPF